jgi:hypothetical protein
VTAALISLIVPVQANCQRVVLFGGSSNSGLVGDTWEWDGEQWTQLGDTGPLPRSGHALTYDSGRQRIVLFGGVRQNNVAWLTLGSGTELNGPRNRMPGRLRASITNWRTTALRDRVVLFGGVSVTTYTSACMAGS